MSRFAIVCPVWREHRYLGLVLEQMAMGPPSIPRFILWQDEPLFWTSDRPRPSGHRSSVAAYVENAHHLSKFTIVKLPRAPQEDEYGGFKALAKLGFELARNKGAEIVIWLDTDWLYTLSDMLSVYKAIDAAPRCSYYETRARHYWRDWQHIYADTNILLAAPADEPDMWLAERPCETIKLPAMCYHPSYVLSDEEMYEKVHAFGHAPYFTERGFYEKEWIGKDDSIVKPWDADITPPPEVMARLRLHGALL